MISSLTHLNSNNLERFGFARRVWRKARWAVGALILGALAFALFTVGLRVYVNQKYGAHIYHDVKDMTSNDSQEKNQRVAIVFGASVWRSGHPSPALSKRVATAAELYHAGKVEKLLLSGDNRTPDYNEPAAMRQTALQMGVPERALVLDYAGRRTYDTCFRAREIFGVQRAVLVTQDFHLARALYLCDSFGVQCVGVPATDRPDEGDDYAEATWQLLRETVATLGAWYDIHIARPTPVLGERIPIN
ncbi:MAG: hypothetical protein NVSMB56_19420 [Pyrinomonadaceae bacterium]